MYELAQQRNPKQMYTATKKRWGRHTNEGFESDCATHDIEVLKSWL